MSQKFFNTPTKKCNASHARHRGKQRGRSRNNSKGSKASKHWSKNSSCSSKKRVSMTNISSFLHKNRGLGGRSKSLVQEFKPLKSYKKIMCSGEFGEKFGLQEPKTVNQTHHNTTISGNNFMTIYSPNNSHKKSNQRLTPSKQSRKNIRKCLKNIFSPSKTKLRTHSNAYLKEIKELKKAKSILKKKLIQITKYSKQKLTKVQKQLSKARDVMQGKIESKFQEYYNILQGFMITVSDVNF